MGYYPLINHTYKFILFWNAKCACSTLKKVFYEITEQTHFEGEDDEIHRHIGLLNSHKYFIPKAELGNYSNYKKIIVCRDPWSRLVSFYANKVIKEDPENYIDKFRIISADQFSFQDFVHHTMLIRLHLLQHHLECQSRNIQDIQFDHVIKLPQLSSQLPLILQDLGVAIADLKSLERQANKTQYIPQKMNTEKPIWELKPYEFDKNNIPNFTSFYNDKLQDLTRQIYIDDINKFGFTYPVQ